MNNVAVQDLAMKDCLDRMIKNIQKKTINKNHINIGNNYKYSSFPIVIVMYGEFDARKTNSLIEKLRTSWTNADLIEPIVICDDISENDAVLKVNSVVQQCLQAEGRYLEYNKCLIAHIVSSENGKSERYFSIIEKINDYVKTANIATKLFSSVFAIFSKNSITEYNELLKAIDDHRDKLTDIYLLSNSRQDGKIVNNSSTDLFDIIGNTILLAGSGDMGNEDDSGDISKALLQTDNSRILQVSYEKANKPDKEIILVTLKSLMDAFKSKVSSACTYDDLKNKLGLDATSGFLERYYEDRIKTQLPQDLHLLVGSFPFDKQTLKLFHKASGRILNETVDKFTFGCWSAFSDEIVKNINFDNNQCYIDCVNYIFSKVTISDIYAHFGNSQLNIDIDNDIDFSDQVDYSGNFQQFTSALSVLFESNIKKHFVTSINDCFKQAVKDLHDLVHMTIDNVNTLSDFCDRELGIRNQMTNQIMTKFADLFNTKKGQMFVDDEQFVCQFIDKSCAGSSYDLKHFLSKVSDVVDIITNVAEYQYDFTDEMSFILGSDDRQPQLGTVLKEMLINNTSSKRYFQYNGMSHTLPLVTKSVLFNGKTKINNYKSIFTNAEYCFFDNNCVDSIETICFYNCKDENQIFIPVDI